MYDVRIVISVVIVTCALRASTKTDESDNLQLSKVFCTPKDFSRVNFDHFEILERNNFDPPITSSTAEDESSLNSKQQHPKSFANAQVMLRIGGDDIKGKNCIEYPQKVVSKQYPITHATELHHQENQIRSSANPFLPYSFVPQLGQYTPIPPYMTVAPLAPPFVFPGYIYSSPDFSAHYAHNGIAASSNNDYGQGNFLENTNREHTIANIINVSHPKILPTTDLTNEIVREAQNIVPDINTNIATGKDLTTKNIEKLPSIVTNTDNKLKEIPMKQAVSKEIPITYKTLSSYDEISKSQNYNMLHYNEKRKNHLLEPTIKKEQPMNILPVTDESVHTLKLNSPIVQDLQDKEIGNLHFHNEAAGEPSSPKQKEKFISAAVDQDKIPQYYSQYSLSHVDPSFYRKNEKTLREYKNNFASQQQETPISFTETSDFKELPLSVSSSKDTNGDDYTNAYENNGKTEPLISKETHDSTFDSNKEIPIYQFTHVKPQISSHSYTQDHSGTNANQQDCEDKSIHTKAYFESCKAARNSLAATENTFSHIPSVLKHVCVNSAIVIPPSTKQSSVNNDNILQHKITPIHRPSYKIPIPVAPASTTAPTKSHFNYHSINESPIYSPAYDNNQHSRPNHIVPTFKDTFNFNTNSERKKASISTAAAEKGQPDGNVPTYTSSYLSYDIVSHNHQEVPVALSPTYVSSIKESPSVTSNQENHLLVHNEQHSSSNEIVPSKKEHGIKKESPIYITPIFKSLTKELPIYGASNKKHDSREEQHSYSNNIVPAYKKIHKEVPSLNHLSHPLHQHSTTVYKKGENRKETSAFPESSLKLIPSSNAFHKEISISYPVKENSITQEQHNSFTAPKETPILTSCEDTPKKESSITLSSHEIKSHKAVPILSSCEELPIKEKPIYASSQKDLPISIITHKEVPILSSSCEETLSKEQPISIKYIKESPISITSNKESPVLSSSCEELSVKETPIFTYVEKESPISITSYKETPIFSPSCEEVSQNENLISISAEKESPISITSYKETPLLSSSCEELSAKESTISISAEKESPISIASFKETPLLYSCEELSAKETPISISATKESPISITSNKETPILSSSCEEVRETPISISATKESPISITSNKETPILSLSCEEVRETPIAISVTKESPISITSNKETPILSSSCEEVRETPISISATKESPISITSNKETPILSSSCEEVRETPISISATKESPISITSDKETPISISAIKESPISITSFKETPISISAVKELPISNDIFKESPINISPGTVKKETPIFIEAKKEAPISITSYKETPISFSLCEEVSSVPTQKEAEISITTYKETPILSSLCEEVKETPISISAEKESPISITSFKETPISISAVKELPISNDIFKESPINISPGTVKKETPIFIEAKKEAPISITSYKETPISFSLCEEVSSVPTQKEAEISITTYKETPILSSLCEEVKETPISISAEKESPISITSNKETPISISAIKESPISITSNKETPISISATKESPISITSNKEIPISTSICEEVKETPIFISAEKESPISITANKETPISISATKESPISITSFKETPISISAVKELPMNISPGTVKKETPIFIEANKEAPISITSCKETPISFSLCEEVNQTPNSVPTEKESKVSITSCEEVKETPISISAEKESPISITSDKETPISVSVVKELPISNDIFKESPINIPPGTVKKETPIFIEAKKEAPISITSCKETPISFSLCEEVNQTPNSVPTEKESEVSITSCEEVKETPISISAEKESPMPITSNKETPISIYAVEESPISITSYKETPILIPAVKELPISNDIFKESPMNISPNTVKKETPIFIEAKKETPISITATHEPAIYIPMTAKEEETFNCDDAIPIREELPVENDLIVKKETPISRPSNCLNDIPVCEETPVVVDASSIVKEAPLFTTAVKETPIFIPIKKTYEELPEYKLSDCLNIIPVFEENSLSKNDNNVCEDVFASKPSCNELPSSCHEFKSGYEGTPVAVEGDISTTDIIKEKPISIDVVKEAPIYIPIKETSNTREELSDCKPSCTELPPSSYDDSLISFEAYNETPIEETPIYISTLIDTEPPLGSIKPVHEDIPVDVEVPIPIPDIFCHKETVDEQSLVDDPLVKESPMCVAAFKDLPIESFTLRENPVLIPVHEKESNIHLTSSKKALLSASLVSPETVVYHNNPVSGTAKKENHSSPYNQESSRYETKPASDNAYTPSNIYKEVPSDVKQEPTETEIVYLCQCKANNKKNNLSVKKDLPLYVYGDDREGYKNKYWEKPVQTYPSSGKPIEVTLNTIQKEKQPIGARPVPQICRKNIENWLNGSLVPYECKDCGKKLLVSYPISQKGDVYSNLPSYDKKIPKMNCPCCQLKGFCDCENCQCGGVHSYPNGKRFDSDVDSLYKIVPCKDCSPSAKRDGYNASPYSPSHLPASLPLPYSSGYSTSFKSTSLMGYMKVGDHEPKVVYNGLTTMSGGGFFTDSHNHVYYKQPTINHIVSKTHPNKPEVQLHCYEPPQIYSVISNHGAVSQYNKPPYVDQFVPTDNFYCSTLPHPHNDKMVCQRQYVKSDDDKVLVQKDCSCTY